MKAFLHKAIKLSVLFAGLQLNGNCFETNNIKTTGFIENRGQVTDQYHIPRNDIDFKMSSKELTVFIGKGKLLYQWSRDEQATTAVQGMDKEPGRHNITFCRMEVALENANVSSTLITEGRSGDYETYYTENTGEKGAKVYSYNKIIYKNIYHNIDWVLYTNNGQLKYDFIVRPGGDPGDIQLKFNGTSGLRLNDGALTAATSFGSITDAAPYCYEQETGNHVAARFVLDNNKAGFITDGYNGTLVIDPTIAWSTYYGGPNDDIGEVITGDKSGNLYLMGTTLSSSNIATSGTYQTTASFGHDAFIARFNSQGQRIWCTYYGGNYDEFTTGGTCDKFGDIYITGYCGNSTSIVTTGAHQTTYGGGTYDGFLAKFNASGQRIWGTFYGGSLEDRSYSVACDTAANVYIAGYTLSTTNIATPGAHHTTLSYTNEDGFLIKFNPGGTRLWGTYYGGSNIDEAYSVVCDSTDKIYLGGFTGSDTAIATPGTVQASKSSFYDAFIVQFNSSGARQWGTYFGSTGDDRLVSLQPDNGGSLYAFMRTSGGIVTTSGSHQPNYGGGFWDAFLMKFTTSGQLIWDTYYGGGDQEEPYSVQLDAHNNIYIAGATTSNNNISTSGGIKPNLTGTEDAFWAAFDTAGHRKYGTYYGGPTVVATDQIHSVYTYGGKVYMAGHSTNSTGIATTGSFQSANQGGDDAFLLRLDPDTVVTISALSTLSFCPGSSFNVNYTVNTSFEAGNVFTVQLSDINGNFSNALNIGSVTAATSGSIPVTIPSSLATGTGYRIRIVASAPYYISDDNNANITVQYNTPSIVISASPGTSVGPGKTILLTANVANGGSSPVVQWRKNGTDIAGATGATYSLVAGTDFVDNDQLTAHLLSNADCVQPDTALSNTLTLTINLHVQDVHKGSVSVFPNPTGGALYINSEAYYAGPVKIEVLDITGRCVYREMLQLINRQLNKQLILPDNMTGGMYMLKISSGNGVQNIPFVLQK